MLQTQIPTLCFMRCDFVLLLSSFAVELFDMPPTDTISISAAIADELLIGHIGDQSKIHELWRILHPWLELEAHGYYLFPRNISSLNPQEKRKFMLSNKPVQYPFAHVGDKSLGARCQCNWAVNINNVAST